MRRLWELIIKYVFEWLLSMAPSYTAWCCPMSACLPLLLDLLLKLVPCCLSSDVILLWPGFCCWDRSKIVGLSLVYCGCRGSVGCSWVCSETVLSWPISFHLPPLYLLSSLELTTFWTLLEITEAWDYWNCGHLHCLRLLKFWAYWTWTLLELTELEHVLSLLTNNN